MNEHDPNLAATVLGWVLNAIFAIVLVIGRMKYSRANDKQDRLEERLRDLELGAVRQEQFLRLEAKMDAGISNLASRIDKQNASVNERLDRILEKVS